MVHAEQSCAGRCGVRRLQTCCRFQWMRMKMQRPLHQLHTCRSATSSKPRQAHHRKQRRCGGRRVAILLLCMRGDQVVGERVEAQALRTGR